MGQTGLSVINIKMFFLPLSTLQFHGRASDYIFVFPEELLELVNNQQCHHLFKEMKIWLCLN